MKERLKSVFDKGSLRDKRPRNLEGLDDIKETDGLFFYEPYPDEPV